MPRPLLVGQVSGSPPRAEIKWSVVGGSSSRTPIQGHATSQSEETSLLRALSRGPDPGSQGSLGEEADCAIGP